MVNGRQLSLDSMPLRAAGRGNQRIFTLEDTV